MVQQQTPPQAPVNFRGRFPYDQWMESTGLPVYRGHYVAEPRSLELGDWLTPTQKPPTGIEARTLEEAERLHILEALEKTKWRVSGPSGAAIRLGLKPTTLESRMKKLGINRPG